MTDRDQVTPGEAMLLMWMNLAWLPFEMFCAEIQI
jgi:hypothetical protein